jgi:hypothetical protein
VETKIDHLEAPIFMDASEPVDQDQGLPALTLIIIE